MGAVHALERAMSRPRVPVTIPLAIATVIRPRLRREISLRRGVPRASWWKGLAADLSGFIGETLLEYEPAQRVTIHREPLSLVVATTEPLGDVGRRVFAVTFVRRGSMSAEELQRSRWPTGTLRLSAQTEAAQRELWRSLYAPEDGRPRRPRCTAHDDCREHPELGRACWAEQVSTGRFIAEEHHR